METKDSSRSGSEGEGATLVCGLGDGADLAVENFLEKGHLNLKYMSSPFARQKKEELAPTAFALDVASAGG